MKPYRFTIFLVGILACQGCSTATKPKIDVSGAASAIQNQQDESFKKLNPRLESKGNLCAAELQAVNDAANGPADKQTQANLDLVNCTLRANNKKACEGKPEPCGKALFHSPSKPEEAKEVTVVDVSHPDEIANACGLIGSTAAAFGGPTAADPELTMSIGGAVGKYTCSAWLKAAAKHDPTLFISPSIAPNKQLLEDVDRWANGNISSTANDIMKNVTSTVERSTLKMEIGGTQLPVAFLPFPSSLPIPPPPAAKIPIPDNKSICQAASGPLGLIACH